MKTSERTNCVVCFYKNKVENARQCSKKINQLWKRAVERNTLCARKKTKRKLKNRVFGNNLNIKFWIYIERNSMTLKFAINR